MVLHQGRTIEGDTKQWKRAILIPPRNNIVIHCRKAFVPAYENERLPNMYKLLSNAYHKEWHAAQIQNYRTVQSRQTAEIEILHRRYFRRKKIEKIKFLPIITLKRFTNVLGKVDTNIGLQHTALFDEESLHADNPECA